MLDTWGQLLTLAAFFTVIALWRVNILLALLPSCLWIALLFYHLSNQPAGIVAGDTADTYIVWGLIIAILAIPMITIFRLRGRTSRSVGSIEGDEAVARSGNPSTLTSMDTQQYQALIRKKLRRRTR